MLSVRPKMSMRSGGEAALSLRDEAVFDRDLDRDSLRRFLFDSLDLDRFLDLSRSLERDLERLLFLLCLLLLECLERDELRLLERPMAMLNQRCLSFLRDDMQFEKYQKSFLPNLRHAENT